MPNLRTITAAVLLAALLHGCATTRSAPLVWIGVDGDDSCIAEVNGRHFSLPADSASLGAYLKQTARSAGGAVMGERPARTSAGCWDEVMALARAARFKRLGYISEGDEPVEPTV